MANGGAPIPPEVMARIFQPFYRAAADGKRQGLGIGLYIASEIARAHGGTLERCIRCRRDALRAQGAGTGLGVAGRFINRD